MSQTEYNQPNEAMVDARANINSILGAILSANSGSSAPTNTETGSVWLDTSTNVLKRRNASDTGWVTIKSLDDDQVISKTSDYTATEGDHDKIILLDASSNTVTLTLPSASTVGDEYRVHIKTINVTNTVTVTGNGSETIDGLSSITLDTVQDGVTIQSDGANNRILTDARRAKYDSNGNIVVSYTGVTTPDSYIDISNADLDNDEAPTISTVDLTGNAVGVNMYLSTVGFGRILWDAGNTQVIMPNSGPNAGQILAANAVDELQWDDPVVTNPKSTTSLYNERYFNGISPDTAMYLLYIDQLTTDTDDDKILFTLGELDNEINDCSWVFTEHSPADASSSTLYGHNFGEVDLNRNDTTDGGLGTGTVESMSGKIWIYDSLLSDADSKIYWDVTYIAADGNPRMVTGQGIINSTRVLDYYFFKSALGGNLSGTIRVYGYRR